MGATQWIVAAALSWAGAPQDEQGLAGNIARGLDHCMLMRPAVPEPDPDAVKYSGIIDRVSRSNGVEGALVHAVIRAESSYNPNALSPAGASGLMQLMPDTAKRYGVRDIFDPAQNVQGGVRHLKDLLEMFGGDLELALAAYNAGPYAVIRAGNKVPPDPQTKAYVPRVIGYYRGLQPLSPQ